MRRRPVYLDKDAPAGHVGRRHEQLLPHAPLNLGVYITQMLLQG